MWKITAAKVKKHHRGDADSTRSKLEEESPFFLHSSLSPVPSHMITRSHGQSRDVVSESQPQHYRAEQRGFKTERNGVIPRIMALQNDITSLSPSASTCIMERGASSKVLVKIK